MHRYATMPIYGFYGEKAPNHAVFRLRIYGGALRFYVPIYGGGR